VIVIEIAVSRKAIKGRSLRGFKRLNVAEKQLLRGCRTGEQIRIGRDRPHVPYPVRTIRGSFLRFLILGGDDTTAIHECGILLQGAYISGSFDLRKTMTSVPFELHDCTFEQQLELSESNITGAIRLLNCRLPAIVANRTVIQSDFHLSNTSLALGLTAWNASIQGNFLFENVQSGGPVVLPGTQINGVLYCLNTSLRAGAGPSLILNNATTGSDILFEDSRLEGVRCQQATIGGSYRFHSTELLSHEGLALDLVGTQVRHNLFMHAAQVRGLLLLANSQIEGRLELDGTFDGEGANAIAAHGAILRGGLSLLQEFTAKGSVNFSKAQLNDTAMLRGRYEAAEQAIVFDAASVEGNLDLSGCEVFGEVSLITTRISHQLNCAGARLHGFNGKALSADSATIGRDANFNPDFFAKGTVRLLCTTFEGDLLFNGARFEGDPGSRSLIASQSKVLGKVVLNIHASGGVSFNDACIEGELRCCPGCIFSTEAIESLSLKRARIKGILTLTELERPLHRVSLEHAHVWQLGDDQNTWGEHIVLNGFKYDALAGKPPLSVSRRLQWLRAQVPRLTAPERPASQGKRQRLRSWLRQCWSGSARAQRAEDFRPQPWWQLKQVLESSAHFAEARRVGIELEKERRKLGLVDQPLDPERPNKGLLSRLLSRRLHWAYGHFTGYGYRPIRLFHYFFGTWLVCALIYWAAALVGIFAPTDPRIYQNPTYQACRPNNSEAWPPIEVRIKENWYLCSDLPAEYTGFSPLAYSLDVLMPFVDLKQETDWAPLVPTPNADPEQEFRALTAQHAVRLVIWLQTLIGWGIGLLAAAIISGLARKTE
jgi:hypothetical protein